MKHSNAKNFVKHFLELADIELNGKQPWDIQIHEERFFERILVEHNLGLGESYMDGWWDCQRLDELVHRILRAKPYQKLGMNLSFIVKMFLQKVFNYQTKSKSKEVAKRHYSLDNNLYQIMLDPTMNYSCGYWKNAENLEQAQRNKMDLICRKLLLKPGMRLLDIGCGWGALAKHAAENYGVSVVGITISDKQKILAEEMCKGLPVVIKLQDYRDLQDQKYDRIASVGMFEHVGQKNYKTYMKIIHDCLSDEGIFLLQTIAGNISQVMGDVWLSKYIFPHGMLPSIHQVGTAIEKLFIMEDWHNFGPDYDKTLLAWHHNFNHHWPELKRNYDERFFRMWNYYLLSCAGTFRARDTQLWQIVLTKNGLKESFTAR